MKTIKLIIVLLLISTGVNAQSDGRTYVVKTTSPGFDLTIIDRLNKQTLDYYRSQSVNNEATLTINGETATIELLSADELTLKVIYFDKSAVLKSQMIFNDNGTTSRSYVWKITDDYSIKDETAY